MEQGGIAGLRPVAIASRLRHTAYVRTDADLVALLQRLRDYLRFFRDELRGRFVTPRALKAELEQLASNDPRDTSSD
jgi:hypothetical protein